MIVKVFHGGHERIDRRCFRSSYWRVEIKQQYWKQNYLSSPIFSTLYLHAISANNTISEKTDLIISNLI